MRRRMYSELISAAIGSGGPHAARTSQVKLMRSVKKVALRLIETFVDKSDDTTIIAQQFVPAMMDPILGDYARNVPDARYAWFRCTPINRRQHDRDTHCMPRPRAAVAVISRGASDLYVCSQGCCQPSGTGFTSASRLKASRRVLLRGVGTPCYLLSDEALVIAPNLERDHVIW